VLLIVQLIWLFKGSLFLTLLFSGVLFSGGAICTVDTSDYTLWTLYRSYFKDIRANVELQVYAVTCCWPDMCKWNFKELKLILSCCFAIFSVLNSRQDLRWLYEVYSSLIFHYEYPWTTLSLNVGIGYFSEMMWTIINISSEANIAYLPNQKKNSFSSNVKLHCTNGNKPLWSQDFILHTRCLLSYPIHFLHTYIPLTLYA
jgi:hypothetical protein